MSTIVDVVVSVSGGRTAETARIVAEMTAAGATVEEVLDEIGVIRARCPIEALPVIERIPGVLSVEHERGVGIPPPSSPIQ